MSINSNGRTEFNNYKYTCERKVQVIKKYNSDTL